MIRDINIIPVLNGFIVKCGCQTLVFNSIERVTVVLGEYLKDPQAVEERYVNNSINSKHVMGIPVTVCNEVPTLDTVPGTGRLLRPERPAPVPVQDEQYEIRRCPPDPAGTGF
jgi:hypothetical protein